LQGLPYIYKKGGTGTKKETVSPRLLADEGKKKKKVTESNHSKKSHRRRDITPSEKKKEESPWKPEEKERCVQLQFLSCAYEKNLEREKKGVD